MKWFELLRQEYDCPVAMLHVPYQADGTIHDHYRDYIVEQMPTEVIPKLEEVSGKSYDEDRLRSSLELSAQAEDDLVWVLEAPNKPSPIDAYFGGVYYIGPIFTAFRGTEEGVGYYRVLREEVEERLARGLGPITPDGELDEEHYRLVVEGPPNWTSFREFWKMFYEERRGGRGQQLHQGRRPVRPGLPPRSRRPLETLADYCLGCYTNLGLPSRVELLEDYVNEYQADGFMINSVKSCNSFSAGQLLMLRQLEERTGVPGGFIESDLVDPRYFSAANIKNRIESYLQMLEQKRGWLHEGRRRHRSRLDHDQGGDSRRGGPGRRPRHHQQPQQLRRGQSDRPPGGLCPGPLQPHPRNAIRTTPSSPESRSTSCRCWVGSFDCATTWRSSSDSARSSTWPQGCVVMKARARNWPPWSTRSSSP